MLCYRCCCRQVHDQARHLASIGEHAAVRTVTQHTPTVAVNRMVIGTAALGGQSAALRGHKAAAEKMKQQQKAKLAAVRPRTHSVDFKPSSGM